MRFPYSRSEESMSTTLDNAPLNFSALNVPAGVFNEFATAPREYRPHWARVLPQLEQLQARELLLRTQHAAEQLAEDGAVYNVFGEQDETQRPWDLDLIPFVVSSDEWQAVEKALDQRARLIDLVIRDLYGPRTLIRDGSLPPELVFSHAKYLRECFQLPQQNEAAVTLYATELARAQDGRWWVMADRLDAPSGAAYTLENRLVTSHALPGLIHRARIQRLAPFFVRLLNALKQRSRRPVENPRIVLLSTGARNRFYFEDVYLARYLGIDLVQGGDLASRDGKIYLKTLAGLMPVDVILNRGREAGIDPLELGGASLHGVPGLLEAIRNETVVVVNTPGSGLLESPVFMAFLPRLCQKLFNEDLQAPSIATWWCGDADARREVFDRLPELVIKPAFEASGSQEILGESLGSGEVAALREKIARRPYHYVAQERILRSAAPVWRDHQIACGHVAVRTFLVNDQGRFHIMPGGFVRTAMSPGPMELSITAGDGSKDLWVLADGPVEPVSLLLPQDRPVELKRSGALFPSRAADDLFWLGQYLERADFLMHLNRAIVDRLGSESDKDQSEIPVLLKALADLGQIDSSFATLNPVIATVELEEQLGTILYDTRNRRGIAHAVSEMLRLGSATRDLLSQDTWRKIHQSAHWYLSGPKRGIDDLGEVLGALSQLQANLAAVSGLIHDGMVRGPSWRFLDMGRRIERGRTASQFLSSLIKAQATSDKQVLKAVLEVIDSRMTYRFRYFDNIQMNAVLDLAITDETNPRAVIFQLAALEQHIDALPTDVIQPLRIEEKRFLMSSVHAVRMLTTESLIDPALEDVSQALGLVDDRLKQLSDTITRNYLLHAGPPRQITGVEVS